MENVFIVIVGILFILAISDLIVGVSNDAVNFLNSAIGSKAAPLRVILIVAALGVLAGTTFSNGMMEVARKSIFIPEAFSFKEIMIIFLAVMLTDVILLDLFNTFGLPTSTTVSIVFELLGAAVGIAIIKVSGENGNGEVISSFINSGKALTIIFGILLSVVVAFSVGALVQWISRLIFSFSFESNIKYFGGIFGGIAVTAITYFILIKGLKGSVYADEVFSSLSLQDWTDFFARQNYDGFKSLVKSLGSLDVGSELAAWGETLSGFDKDTYKEGISQFVAWSSNKSTHTIEVPLMMLHWVKYYTMNILLISFVSCTALLQLLYSFFKFNILKLVVIIGTFALAMAFAGNDLVNFIGVPLAGFSSYQEFVKHGANDTGFMMEALSGKVDTNPIFLLIAGLIMVITLWLSKKAKSVVKTTLNLSDQDTVNERFESSALARALVRIAVKTGSGISVVVPRAIKTRVSNRFDTSKFKTSGKKEEGVSFDLLRASVNLVVASVLIALGTSLKLPLSTTYVTFMVAMGTSLADGAWDRESAVYRITGVITVIGGWFFTAFSAFTVALIVALLLYASWWIGVFVMAAVALYVIYRTHILHKKRSEAEEKAENADAIVLSDTDSMFESCTSNVISLLLSTSETYSDTVNGLALEKRKKLKETFKKVNKIDQESKAFKKKIPEVFKDLGEESFESGQHYVEVIDFLREAMHSLFYFTSPAFKHVDNNHKPLTSFQIEALTSLSIGISDYMEKLINNISSTDFKNSAQLIDQANEIMDAVVKFRKKNLKQLKKEPGSTRTNLLFLDLLNETKNLVLNTNNMYKAFRDFYELNQQTSIKKLI